jgi:diaminopimelate epimerase
VKIVESVEMDDFIEQARSIRNSERFKQKGVNVNFVQMDRDKIVVRTFERGVEDETLSCGTGVVASAIVASILNPEYANPVAISTKGGELSVGFSREGNSVKNVYLTGPAVEVFRGFVEL